MTKEQEISIIESWALTLNHKYDIVEFYGIFRGYNIFCLYDSNLLGHRRGKPTFAIVGHKSNKPRLLTKEETWLVMNT